MANNISVKDAASATQTLKTTDTSSVHTPHHNVDVIAAGENHIGQTGFAVVTSSVTPTVSTSPAYASGDAVGGKLTFSGAARVSGRGGRLSKAIITDKAKQSAALDLILFDADPTGTTFTDNAALTIADADLTKIIGVFSVIDWAPFADNSVGMMALEQAFKLPSGTDLFGCLVSRGTPTYASTSDVTVRLVIEQG